MLTPNYLITSQSEEGPRADHTLLLEHHKTPHLKSRVGHTVLKALACGGPIYVAKQKKASFSTLCKTPSPCFYLASVNRGWVSATFTQSSSKRQVTDSHTRELRPRMIHWLSIGCSAIRAEKNLQSKNYPSTLTIKTESGKRTTSFQKVKVTNSETRSERSGQQYHKSENTMLPGGGGVG